LFEINLALDHLIKHNGVDIDSDKLDLIAYEIKNNGSNDI